MIVMPHERTTGRDSARAKPRRQPGHGRRGPLPAKLDSRKRKAFLDLMARGLGRRAACIKLGVGYRTFQRTCREDEEFAEEVEAAQASWEENLESAAYMMALDGDKEVLL